jgi:hypothetical protein
MALSVTLLCLIWAGIGCIFGYGRGVADALRSVAMGEPSTLKQIEVIKLKIKQKRELELLEKGKVS